jgi:1-acyl-sn-glycerol-3-phosphate acyltransferase
MSADGEAAPIVGGGDTPATPARRLRVTPTSLVLRLPRSGRTFPWLAPTWPGGVERLPVERRLGVDYDTAWARRYPARLARAVVADNITRPLVRAVASPTVEGRDRIRHLDEPVIFAANHASHVDTPLLLSVLPDRWRHRTVVAAGADYFFDKRWTAILFSFLINAIPIERLRVNRRSADLAARLLEEGWSLLIYPEGGRTPDGWGQSHRAGAAWLSVRTGRPLVPVYVEGTRRILPRHGAGLRPGRTRVTFGRPLRPAPGQDARELAVAVERAVSVLADEQTTDWWTATRRAAAGTTPPLTGPAGSRWRRTWALTANERVRGGPSAGGDRRWPDP